MDIKAVATKLDVLHVMASALSPTHFLKIENLCELEDLRECTFHVKCNCSDAYHASNSHETEELSYIDSEIEPTYGEDIGRY